MLTVLLQITAGIIGLSIVVLVHEGGHYTAALASGIRVKTFSIGFGRKIAGFTKNGTEYRISVVPLGGYCRFYGEESFRKAVENKQDKIDPQKGDYYTAHPLKRIIVALSGPAANLIFALIVFTMISWIGYNETYTEPRIILVSEYTDNSKTWPADKAGLKSGDYISAVDDQKIYKFSQIREKIYYHPGKEVKLTVLRNGREITVYIKPELDKNSGTAIIGVYNWVDPVIDKVEKNSPAYNSGFRDGDIILSVNGEKVSNTLDFYTKISKYPDADVSVKRNGKTVLLKTNFKPDAATGIMFRLYSGRSADLNLLQALFSGFSQLKETIEATAGGLSMLFKGVKFTSTVSGPIRLISDTGTIFVSGFKNGFGPGMLWSFKLMALISISLGFINLLPIPVLDGGQILLFSAELIRRKPIKPKYVYSYQLIGTIIVLILAVAATAGDIININQR